MRIKPGIDNLPVYRAAPRPPLDRDRLRAALRLLFSGPEADRLAALATDGVAPLIGPALSRYTFSFGVRRLAAAFGRLRGRPTTRESPPGNELPDDESDNKPPLAKRPLAPGCGAPARAALALALHLGLALDGETLADLFQTTPERIGADLDRARRAACPALPVPCRGNAALVGRIGDHTLDVNSRLSLLTHAQTCQPCRRAIEATQALDAELRATIDEHRAALPAEAPAPGHLARLLASPAAVIAGLAVALVLLLVGGNAVAGRLTRAGHTPIPLHAAAAPTPGVEGWLVIEESQGALSALNLATHERRDLIGREQRADIFTQHWLSPDRNRIATWSGQFGQDGVVAGRMTLRRIDGTVTHTWERLRTPDEAPPYPVGWLTDREMLFVLNPPSTPGISHDEWLQIVRTRSQLLAVDPETGQSRLLFEGDVNAAIASPDGSLVALIGTYDPTRPGQTLQIRPVEPDNLGAPIVTMEHRYLGSALWAPDSSRLYYADAGEPRAGQGTSGAVMRGPSSFPESSLVAIERDGRMTTVHRAPPMMIAAMLGVSRDGRSIVYHQFTPTGPTSVAEVWLAGEDGSDAHQIGTGNLFGMTGATWLPDGTLLLVNSEQTYLPDDPLHREPGPAGWPVARAIRVDGSSDILLSAPGLLRGSPLAWLPPDALPPSAPAGPTAGQANPPERVRGVAPGHRLFAGSSASPEGTYVLLMDDTLRGPVIWQRGQDAGSGRTIEFASDLSWVPGVPVMVGVVPGDARGQSTQSSRIAFYAARLEQGLPTYDFRRFDPAELGDATDRRYARPLVAPGGGSTAFFVIDDQRGTTTLWLAGWDAPPHEVASWASPVSRAGPQAPLATWVDANTLVYAEPAGWRDGFAQRVTLRRIAVENGRESEATDLLTLQTQGSERGIALRELAVSPGGSALAYRLRHYAHPDPDTGAFDTLSLIQADDASAPLEVERGGTGSGLAWSPDGTWLAASVRGRIALISSDGRTQQSATPSGVAASYPVWAGPDELWFAADPGGADPRIMRVLLR